jgi:hypothetical protein
MNSVMTLTRYFRRFLLTVAFLAAVSVSNAATQPGGRLIVIRTANFGWNLAANLKIDGKSVANIVQGRRYDHWIPAGRHVLTVSAVPNVELRQATSIIVNVRPTTLSPAEMAKLGL